MMMVMIILIIVIKIRVPSGGVFRKEDLIALGLCVGSLCYPRCPYYSGYPNPSLAV